MNYVEFTNFTSPNKIREDPKRGWFGGLDAPWTECFL